MIAGPIRIRDLPWEELRKLLRKEGPNIRLLADRGDKFAKKVYDVYLEACRLPIEHPKNLELRIAIDDYMNRDLRQHERTELEGKFGHRVDLPDPDRTRIYVPGSPVKQ
jgi:hypothetical protein